MGQLTSVVLFVREIPENFPCTIASDSLGTDALPACLPVARKLPQLTLAAGSCVFHLHHSVRSSLRDLPCVEEVPVAFRTPCHAECFKNTPALHFKAHHTCGRDIFGLAAYPEVVLNTSSV